MEADVTKSKFHDQAVQRVSKEDKAASAVEAFDKVEAAAHAGPGGVPGAKDIKFKESGQTPFQTSPARRPSVRGGMPQLSRETLIKMAEMSQ